jgi:hypothetical protein
MWRLQIILATLLIGLLPGALGRTPIMDAPTANAAAPPCNNYSSNITPPENIGVGITNSSGTVVDAVYVDFKSYVRDVLPNEWLPGWESGAYQAGALAVKQYAWYLVLNWEGNSFGGVQCG